jgi:hypothetical protein
MLNVNPGLWNHHISVRYSIPSSFDNLPRRTAHSQNGTWDTVLALLGREDAAALFAREDGCLSLPRFELSLVPAVRVSFHVFGSRNGQ